LLPVHLADVVRLLLVHLDDVVRLLLAQLCVLATLCMKRGLFGPDCR